jgi:hypothetical protein
MKIMYSRNPFTRVDTKFHDTKFRNKKLLLYFAKWSYYFAKFHDYIMKFCGKFQKISQNVNLVG